MTDNRNANINLEDWDIQNQDGRGNTGVLKAYTALRSKIEVAEKQLSKVNKWLGDKRHQRSGDYDLKVDTAKALEMSLKDLKAMRESMHNVNLVFESYVVAKFMEELNDAISHAQANRTKWFTKLTSDIDSFSHTIGWHYDDFVKASAELNYYTTVDRYIQHAKDDCGVINMAIIRKALEYGKNYADGAIRESLRWGHSTNDMSNLNDHYYATAYYQLINDGFDNPLCSAMYYMDSKHNVIFFDLPEVVLEY